MNTVSQIQQEVQKFFSSVDESLANESKISSFLESLTNTNVKLVEETQENTLRQLMIILLKIISVAPAQIAVSACDKVLLYLKKISLMYDLFNPNTELLKKLNLKRLVSAKQSEIVYDLMIFILRYYSDVDYDDYDLGQQGKETLLKEEKKRLYLTLDHILVRQDKIQDDLKGHSVECG